MSSRALIDTIPTARASKNTAQWITNSPKNYSMDQSSNGRNRTHCEACIHRTICMASKMNFDLLSQFDRQIIRDKPMRKGKHLYWQDSPFKEVFIVHSGAVKAYKLSSTGDEQIVGFYYPGDIIGTDGLFNGRHVNSVVTLDVTTVCALPFSNMSDLLSHSGEFQKCLLSMLSGEIRQEQNHRTFAKKSVDERLASFLIEMSLRNQRSNFSSSSFQLLMKRKDIANYLGLAVETISRMLTRFQAKGWIVIDGHEVELINRQALERLIAGDTDII